MRKCVPYIRTSEGTIERLSGAVFNASDGSLDPYVHEESLVGWPESKVFWAKETGPSVGVAPFLYFPLVDLRQLASRLQPDNHPIVAETPWRASPGDR